MAVHRHTPILPSSHAARLRLPHRAARPAPTRGLVEPVLGRHAWSATGTITAFRAQRGIQPW